MNLCPCGSSLAYQKCCEQFITNQQKPQTAEELMRSRYTAYTKANINYIIQTMRPPASNDFNAESALQWAQRVKWIKLEIIKTYALDNKGWVEFIAYYSEQNILQILHELSEFECLENCWYYVSGSQPIRIKLPQIGRNDPCICGSSKKFKKCCG